MDLILLAGGKGERSGLPYPKVLFPINGTPILRLLIDFFRREVPIIENIVVPCSDEVAEHCSDCVVVPAGHTRQHSVRNALELMASDMYYPRRVMIHEAARPFLDRPFIEELCAVDGSCVVPTLPVRSAMYCPWAYRHVDREAFVEIQTPQVFNFEELLLAHRAHPYGRVHDDSATYRRAFPNTPMVLVEGREYNIKLTTPTDFKMAEAYWRLIH